MGRSPSHKKEHTKVPEWAAEQQEFQKKKKYPFCKGTFPDCPSDIKENEVASECEMCPIYKRT
jgi:hypothetical protein